MSGISKPGHSSTGSPRGLGVERDDGAFRFVVIGADGKKQHASTIVSEDDAVAIAKYILAQANSDEGDE